MAKHKFTGNILDWNLNGSRKYIIGATTYGNLRKFSKVFVYSSENDEGEQRKPDAARIKKLKKVMEDGTYAVTVATLGTRESHRKEISVDNKTMILEVDESSPLPLLDAGGRFGALEEIRNFAKENEKIVDGLKFPFIMYLDGDPRQDFLALNAGTPPSRDHLHSMRVASGLVDSNLAPYYRLAKETARILHTEKDSPFHNIIMFDTKSKGLLSLSSLSTKSAREIAFGLFGGAKTAIAAGKDAQWLANCILTAYRTLESDPDDKGYFNEDNLLVPVSSGGTKSGSGFIIALGNMLAERLLYLQEDEPSDADLCLLLDAAEEALIVPALGNTDKQRKPKLLGDFCRYFFEDIVVSETDEDESDEDGIDVPAVNKIGAHEGIPLPTLKRYAPSAFGVGKLPKAEKKKKAKAASRKKNQDDSDILGETDDSVVIGEADEDGDWSKENEEALVNAKKLNDEADEEGVAPWDVEE